MTRGSGGRVAPLALALRARAARVRKEAECRRTRADELRASLATRLAQQRRRLEVMSQRHAINDCFYIWHSGPFATINGFRLGRLPNDQVPAPLSRERERARARARRRARKQAGAERRARARRRAPERLSRLPVARPPLARAGSARSLLRRTHRSSGTR